MTQNQREGGRAEGELEPSLPPPAKLLAAGGGRSQPLYPSQGPPYPQAMRGPCPSTINTVLFLILPPLSTSVSLSGKWGNKTHLTRWVRGLNSISEIMQTGSFGSTWTCTEQSKGAGQSSGALPVLKVETDGTSLL